jgi:serine/threonine-protein kinase
MSDGVVAPVSRRSRLSLAGRNMFTLKLLGGASLERSGTQVPGRAARGHRLALLALLARGRSLSRDRILALLYPETDTDRGRRALSDTLYLLRGALGDRVLAASGDEVRLNHDAITSDVAEFERHLDEGRPEDAVATYKGPFLDGFHLAESAEFEQWVDGERDRLGARYSAALERLAEAREADTAWNAAAGWWRRLAVLEPANGRIALRLMLALDRAGDRAGALQHARVHSALLKEDYDAEPDPEMVALIERLKREPVSRPAARDAKGPDEAVEDAAEAGRAGPVLPPALEVRQMIEPVVMSGHATSVSPAFPRRPRRMVGAALAFATIGIALVAVLVARPGSKARTGGGAAAAEVPAPARRSIAVLPFANLSANPDNDYFSDGLTEELIGVLSRIEGLRVAARTSSFAVGGGRLDVRAIGDTLGVAAVLEGSVRRDGGRLRVSARLADTETGYQIWADDYDRELADIFAVQDEIAGAIAHALEVKLAATDSAPVRRTPTLDAYDLYLRGIFVRNKLTSDGLSRAIDFFDRAIQLDSTYALAYAGKATALAPLVWYRHLPRAQGLPAMRAATARALELDETLGEAHVAQGMIHFYFDRDWPAVEREYQRAVALNPSDQHAHHMYANYLVAMGRLDEGIAERKVALQLDPLSHRSGMLLGRDYFIAGRFEEAIEQYQRAVEIDSTSPLALGTGQEGSFGLGDVYARQGRDDDAFAEYMRIARLEGVPAADLARFREGYGESGLAGYWRRRLDYELREGGMSAEALRIASLLARVGDAEQTVRWIERAYDEQAMALAFLAVLPVYDGVRSHPRFMAVLEKLRLTSANERAAEARSR